MINIDKPVECTGCGACVDICPKNVISLLPDESGFLYPNIDTKNCIECSLCNTVCQIEKKFTMDNYKQSFYALINKNKQYLSNKFKHSN